LLVGARIGEGSPGMTAPDRITMFIRAIRVQAETVWSFELAPVSGAPLPAYAPGSHIDLHLPGGMVRQYSLTNISGGDHYEVAVSLDRNSRGGSRWFHECARPGMRLEIGGPRNSFPLADADRSVFFAGGIGITPIRAMVKSLEKTGRAWKLHYAARTRSAAAFVDEFEALGPNVHLHFDDRAGGLFDMAGAVAQAPAGAHLYCCGPEPMIAAFLDAAKDWPQDQVHVEYFTPAPVKAGEGGFLVELARSGITVEVRPDQTILDAVLAAGVPAANSCRNGLCGTCETRVLAGEPDHRDLILSEAERRESRTMMICCSRAKSPSLTLDL
jgi:tetrachlorobenzoquinone reductase